MIELQLIDDREVDQTDAGDECVGGGVDDGDCSVSQPKSYVIPVRGELHRTGGSGSSIRVEHRVGSAVIDVVVVIGAPDNYF